MSRLSAFLLLLLVAGALLLPTAEVDAAIVRPRGTVLSQSATCTTSYAGGTAYSPVAERLTVFISITKAGAGSSMSSAEFKVQIYDGAAWHDVASTRNNSTVDTKIEHTVTAPSAGQSTTIVLQTESHSPSSQWRLAGKVTGGACVSGDILTAKAHEQ